jgi:hypothetical protein
MNGSFIATGLLVIAGAFLMRFIWPAGRLARVALVLWVVVVVIGKTGVGLVPENTNLALHTLLALNVPVDSVAILLLSLSVLKIDRPIGGMGVALGVLGLLGFVLTTAGQFVGPAAYLGLGPGGMERVAEYPAALRRFVVGVIAVTSVAVIRPRFGGVAQLRADAGGEVSLKAATP